MLPPSERSSGNRSRSRSNNNSPINKMQDTASRGLNSPRGGDMGQNSKQSLSKDLIRFYLRNHVMFLWALIALPALMWTSQWNEYNGKENEQLSSKRLTRLLNLPSSVLLRVETVEERIIESDSIIPNKRANESNVSSSFIDPSIHPVIPMSVYEADSSNPLQVIFIGAAIEFEQVDDDDKNEKTKPRYVTSMLLDGLDRSKYVNVVASFVFFFQELAQSVNEKYKSEYLQQDIWQPVLHNKTPIVIVVDWSSLKRDCHVLKRVLSLVNRQFEKLDQFVVRVILIDDSSSTRTDNYCYDSISSDSYRPIIVKRSVVEGRYWDSSSEWVQPGNAIFSKDSYSNNSLYRLPLILSEMWVADLHTNVKKRLSLNNNSDYTDKFIGSSRALRSTDLSVLYNGDSSHYSFFRKKVKSILKTKLEELRIAYLTSNPQKVESTSLINQFVTSKIVLISQADEWEGDDNNYYTSGSLIMQAMASGAMVLCDDMIAKPVDFRNKTNIVFYNSSSSLESLILYYLRQTKKREAIATHGLQTALGRHRVWHVVEELLFGRPLTRTDKYWEQAPPSRRDNRTPKSAKVIL